MKERLDVMLVKRALASSREKAQEMIRSGSVYVDGKQAVKAGSFVEEGAVLEVRGETLRYVGRGGLKLEKALETWKIRLEGLVCMDVGASTGGFTDCMLQQGAARVYSVDVGRGQLAPVLRQDPRVICMEQTNFRYMTREDLQEQPAFISVDVSFISLEKMLGPAMALLRPGGRMVCLIKPQFEAGRGRVGKKGVVRQPGIHREVIGGIVDLADLAGFSVLGLDYSPIKGPEGNVEGEPMKHFLIYANERKDKNLAAARQIQRYLELKGKHVTLLKNQDSSAGQEPSAERACPAGQEPSAGRACPAGQGPSAGQGPPDSCLLVLGGDGTVLQAVREYRHRALPIIGVNLGTLGYMTEIEMPNLEESLDRLIAGDFVRESRMMLKGMVHFSHGGSEEGFALNDIVISRSGSLQIIKFSIYVNGQFLNDYHADGMIVTTPTGSTGYNLSAGGPLVEPGARLIMLTPICPHSLNQRSIILSSEDVVDIEIPERGEGGVQTVEASFDASHVVPLETGDRVRITQWEESAEFLRLDQVSFLEVLHRKMQG